MKTNYSGILQNAKHKETFGNTVVCLLNNVGYDGITGNDKVDVLQKVIEIGKKNKFDVTHEIKETVSVMGESHDAKFMKNVKDVLKLIKSNIGKIEPVNDPVEMHVDGFVEEDD